MPRPPKKAKPPKPDFVFPPGGAALAPVPGLRLKPRTGDVPRWWPVDKPGKAPFACNVEGVNWLKRDKRWEVQHTDPTTNKRKRLGYFTTLEGACGARAAVVDGKATKGDLIVVDGHLCVTACTNNVCRRTNIPATEFAPDVFKFKKNFHKYVNALALLLSGLTEKTRLEIDNQRMSMCMYCRGMARKSATNGEHSEAAKCRRIIAEIKQYWAINGGCNQCGNSDINVLSGDHKNRNGKNQYNQTLDPSWWAYNGGAEALRAHYLGCSSTVQCLCLFCHALEESHSIHEGAGVEDLADGSVAKCTRKYRLAKRKYVNEEKLRRGKCEHPNCCHPHTGRARIVTSETCHGFHFAHKDDTDKLFTIADVVNNNQSPAIAIPKLDKEMPKCNVYCANCHHKYDTLPRLKEGRELLDALLARGAPVCEECE